MKCPHCDKEIADAEIESDRQMKEIRQNNEWKNTDLLPKLRNAVPPDYKAWLVGHLKKGGEITHSNDYKMPDNWYVAKTNIDLRPLYGTQSVNIIIPEGLSVKFLQGLGHCSLYFMEGFEQCGGWIPTYANVPA